MLLSWIYYCLFTMLCVYDQGLHFVEDIMNLQRIRSARGIRQPFPCKMNRMPWQFFHMIFYFISFFKYTCMPTNVVHDFRSPCNLIASVGKLSTITFSIGIKTFLVIERQLKINCDWIRLWNKVSFEFIYQHENILKYWKRI